MPGRLSLGQTKEGTLACWNPYASPTGYLGNDSIPLALQLLALTLLAGLLVAILVQGQGRTVGWRMEVGLKLRCPSQAFRGISGPR